MPLIRNFHKKNGVCIFDSAIDVSLSTYEAHHLAMLAQVEETHFWFQMRRDKICQTFESYVPKSSKILEVGGGTGFIASKIKTQGFLIEMADIHAEALGYAEQRGISSLYQFDLFNPPFESEFDVVCFFDVLEHLHDPVQAINCLKKMLKSNGMLIFTVPAHQWLWSRSDVIAGHQCRYTKRKLKQLCLDSQLQLVSARYFFTALLPLLLVRRLLKKDDGAVLKKGEIFEMQINPFLNRALSLLTRAEFYLDPLLPNLAGGSLLAVAVNTE